MLSASDGKAEMFQREQAALLGHLDRGVEQIRDGVVLDEPIPVLAEH
jgi:hypothetical protein